MLEKHSNPSTKGTQEVKSQKERKKNAKDTRNFEARF